MGSGSVFSGSHPFRGDWLFSLHTHPRLLEMLRDEPPAAEQPGTSSDVSPRPSSTHTRVSVVDGQVRDPSNVAYVSLPDEVPDVPDEVPDEVSVVVSVVVSEVVSVVAVPVPLLCAFLQHFTPAGPGHAPDTNPLAHACFVFMHNPSCARVHDDDDGDHGNPCGDGQHRTLEPPGHSPRCTLPLHDTELVSMHTPLASQHSPLVCTRRDRRLRTNSRTKKDR